MTRSTLAFLAVLLIFSLACALLDDEATNITYEEGVPVSFAVNADALCPPNADCSGESVDSPDRVELLPVEFDVNIDIVEATGNEDLADASGQFRSIEITSIQYEASSNTLNFDLPPIKIFVGPLAATSPDDEGVVELTTIPSIGAGETPSGQADVSTTHSAAASELFKTLKFSALPHAEPVIEAGQPFPPKGAANLKLTINLKLVANPVDAL